MDDLLPAKLFCDRIALVAVQDRHLNQQTKPGDLVLAGGKVISASLLP